MSNNIDKQFQSFNSKICSSHWNAFMFHRNNDHILYTYAENHKEIGLVVIE